MSFRQSIRDGFLGRAFAMIGAANAASAAVKIRPPPPSRDLKKLGIDPGQFDRTSITKLAT